MTPAEEQSEFWLAVGSHLSLLEVYVATPSLLNAEPVFRLHSAEDEAYELAIDCASAQCMAWPVAIAYKGSATIIRRPSDRRSTKPAGPPAL